MEFDFLLTYYIRTGHLPSSYLSSQQSVDFIGTVYLFSIALAVARDLIIDFQPTTKLPTCTSPSSLSHFLSQPSPILVFRPASAVTALETASSLPLSSSFSSLTPLTPPDGDFPLNLLGPACGGCGLGGPYSGNDIQGGNPYNVDCGADTLDFIVDGDGSQVC